MSLAYNFVQFGLEWDRVMLFLRACCFAVCISEGPLTLSESPAITCSATQKDPELGLVGMRSSLACSTKCSVVHVIGFKTLGAERSQL
eukprot:6193786-Pleurochrysis_carterae.AAC.1